MARQLRFHVLLDGEWLPSGTVDDGRLGQRVTNPAAWVGEPDEEPAQPKKAAKKAPAKAVQAPAQQVQQPPVQPGAAPPREGEGATDEAWRAYAASLGQDVAEDSSRDQVIEQLEAAGLL